MPGPYRTGLRVFEPGGGVAQGGPTSDRNDRGEDGPPRRGDVRRGRPNGKVAFFRARPYFSVIVRDTVPSLSIRAA